MQDPQTYLTTSGVAHQLNRSTERVRQLARSGELVPAIITSNGARLFTPDEVRRYQQRRSDKTER